MYTDSAYLLPSFLALVHVASAAPAAFVARAADGINPLPPFATGSLPKPTPEPSQIQISYGLAPSIAPVAPVPILPSPIDGPISPEVVYPDQFDKRQLDDEPDTARFSSANEHLSNEQETPVNFVEHFDRRQLDNETEYDPPSADNETVYDPPSADNETVPIFDFFPDTKREALPILPPNSYAQPDATTIIIPAPTPTPAAPSFDINSYISYLENLTLDGKVKRAPAPTPPPNSYLNPEATTVIIPAPTPEAAAPSFDINSYISYLENLTLDGKVKRAPAPTPPPNSYLDPEATTVIVPAPTPEAAAPSLDLASYISYLQNLNLNGKVKRAPAPTPPSGDYAPTDVITVSEIPFQTPVAATPTQQLPSIIPELQSLGLLLPYAKRGATTAAPAPTAVIANAKRQFDDSWWSQLVDAPLPEVTVAGVSQDGSMPTVVGVSQDGSMPTVMGVSVDGPAPTWVGVSAA